MGHVCVDGHVCARTYIRPRLSKCIPAQCIPQIQTSDPPPHFGEGRLAGHRGHPQRDGAALRQDFVQGTSNIVTSTVCIYIYIYRIYLCICVRSCPRYADGWRWCINVCVEYIYIYIQNRPRTASPQPQQSPPPSPHSTTHLSNLNTTRPENDRTTKCGARGTTRARRWRRIWRSGW